MKKEEIAVYWLAGICVDYVVSDKCCNDDNVLKYTCYKCGKCGRQFDKNGFMLDLGEESEAENEQQ